MEERGRLPIKSEWAGRVLLSLGIAIVLWGFVTTTRDPERSRTFANVPIESSQIGDGLIIITQLPTANVTVTGPRSVVEDLVSTDVHPTLDLASITVPGTYTVRLSTPKPDDAWSVSSNPKSVNLVVEQLITQAFPVSQEVTGSLGSHQQIDSVDPSTSEVTVSGPASLVNRIAKIVLPIDIGDKTGDFANVFTPVARDENGETIAGVSITPETISASVKISTRGKEIAVITQLSGSPASGFEIGDRRIIPDTVLVDGPEDVLASLITVNTDVVDISGATSDVSQTVNLVGLPEGVTVIDPASRQVQVIVQIRQRGVQQPLPSQQVTVINVGEGLDAAVTPGSVRITVIGNEQEIENLSPESLIVQVDAAGLEPGTYQLEPTVILPPNMEWTDIEPSSVTVTVTRATAPGSASASPLASPAATPVP